MNDSPVSPFPVSRSLIQVICIFNPYFHVPRADPHLTCREARSFTIYAFNWFFLGVSNLYPERIA